MYHVGLYEMKILDGDPPPLPFEAALEEDYGEEDGLALAFNGAQWS